MPSVLSSVAISVASTTRTAATGRQSAHSSKSPPLTRKSDGGEHPQSFPPTSPTHPLNLSDLIFVLTALTGCPQTPLTASILNALIDTSSLPARTPSRAHTSLSNLSATPIRTMNFERGTKLQ